ncbi:MAG TPA: phage holin family protein [Ktedonobacterales bacterium]|nr:phage holin family protein [Ktedonobacterales bacterium]
MLRLLVRWVMNALALLLIAYLLPDMHVTFGAALVAAIVIGAINTLVRPILVALTLPVTVLTLGIFLFVVNALLFWLAGLIVPVFTVDGIGAALLGSFLYSILTSIIIAVTRGNREKQPEAHI